MSGPGETQSLPRRNAAAVWTGLFAILMLFIGPLVSQSMALQHHVVKPAAMHAHQAHHGNTEADPQLHASWEKCGYCSLFLHTPALPGAQAPVTCAAPRNPFRYTASTRRGHSRQALFPGALTRAPPHSRNA